MKRVKTEILHIESPKMMKMADLLARRMFLLQRVPSLLPVVDEDGRY